MPFTSDKDKKKIQKEISLVEKKKKDDIKKLDNTYRAEQRSVAGIGKKSKSAMETDKLALENKKKAYEALKSQMVGKYADPSVLEDEKLFTPQKGNVAVDKGRKLFGVSNMDQKDERITKKENVEQVRKDAEI